MDGVAAPPASACSNAELLALESCNPYPIRTIGHIQPHGLMLVVQASSQTVLQVCDNLEQLLGIDPAEILNRSLESLGISALVELVNYELNAPESRALTEADYVLSLRVTEQAIATFPCIEQIQQVFCCQIYRQQPDLLILELEPQSTHRGTRWLQDSQCLRDAIACLKTGTSITNVTTRLVHAVRDLTAFDRVMVYQFQADHSGVVLAEARTSQTESFLGLHFPATDIPEESRQLFYQNSLRFIPDLNYLPAALVPAINPLTQAPLDLGQTMLRGVAQPHVQYLQNMGVGSSMTLSLTDDHKLWGLVACHHRSAKFIDTTTRYLFEILAKVASLELVQRQQHRQLFYQEHNARLQAELQTAVATRSDTLKQVVADNGDRLLEMFRACGLVMISGDQYLSIGQTPAEAAVRSLAAWLLPSSGPLFATDCLSQVYQPWAEIAPEMNGLLSISVALPSSQPGSCQLLLFRLEQWQLVNWAGNLNRSVTTAADGAICRCPRNSFALWQQTVKGKSMPWSEQEIIAATELQNTLLLTLQDFAHEAPAHSVENADQAQQSPSAHRDYDIRTPVQAVLGFTDLLTSLAQDLTAQDYLRTITSSGKTLLTHINDILNEGSNRP